jgi:acyl-CoA reductase-like NAD-dependent aldehyde dehydrogenase
VGTLWIPVRNSLDLIRGALGAGVIKVSLHLDTEDAVLLDRYAAAEEAVEQLARERAKAAGEKPTEPKISLTRKSVAEIFLHEQCGDLRARLTEQVKACGEMPDEKDQKAVAEYAARVLDWRNKKLKRG